MPWYSGLFWKVFAMYTLSYAGQQWMRQTWCRFCSSKCRIHRGNWNTTAFPTSVFSSAFGATHSWPFSAYSNCWGWRVLSPCSVKQSLADHHSSCSTQHIEDACSVPCIFSSKVAPR